MAWFAPPTLPFFFFLFPLLPDLILGREVVIIAWSDGAIRTRRESSVPVPLSEEEPVGVGVGGGWTPRSEKVLLTFIVAFGREGDGAEKGGRGISSGFL
eukprot:537040-Amorphochlora_amoeboformis.AAC.1